MEQSNKRIRLKSLSDIQREHAKIYREGRQKKISTAELTALSQALNRHHTMVVQERELDVSEQLAEIQERLVSIEERR